MVGRGVFVSPGSPPAGPGCGATLMEPAAADPHSDGSEDGEANNIGNGGDFSERARGARDWDGEGGWGESRSGKNSRGSQWEEGCGVPEGMSTDSSNNNDCGSDSNLGGSRRDGGVSRRRRRKSREDRRPAEGEVVEVVAVAAAAAAAMTEDKAEGEFEWDRRRFSEGGKPTFSIDDLSRGLENVSINVRTG